MENSDILAFREKSRGLKIWKKDCGENMLAGFVPRTKKMLWARGRGKF